MSKHKSIESFIVDLISTRYFLLFQTIIISVYILWNTYGPAQYRFDSFPFIFLNLGLSLQAAYTAPIILIHQRTLAENDKRQAEQDRKNTRQILRAVKVLENNLITHINTLDDGEEGDNNNE